MPFVKTTFRYSCKFFIFHLSSLLDYILILTGLAAFVAGFVDAIVGGGGLVQAPAMLILYPQLSVLTVIGTNRLSSFSGTLMAGYQYARKFQMPWKVILYAGIGATICAYIGALYASFLPEKSLKILLLVVMTLLAVYTFFKKELGQTGAEVQETPALLYKSLLLGAVIGFYNGFVGPGTGTLLVFGFVVGLRFSFLQGSGIAKFVNVIADISSLAFFLFQGLVLFHLALPMLVCNVLGSYLGSRLAVLKGSSFIRIMFIAVVTALIGKFGYDVLVR